jgi:carboxymethylenebutenolidase
MAHFESGGKQIRIDHYQPKGEESRPAVLLVHGSGGALAGFDPYAQQAANFGVHVFVVHYFDRTGHTWVYPSQIPEHFLEWLQTLKDALDVMVNAPGVDSSRIGLLGFSLGSYLSLALATQDKRIRAVAELFGGLPEPFTAQAANLPPVLILHGERDPVVPVAEAYALQTLLAKHDIPHEVRIYPDQGHSLNGFAQMDALARIVSFFRNRLV